MSEKDPRYRDRNWNWIPGYGLKPEFQQTEELAKISQRLQQDPKFKLDIPLMNEELGAQLRESIRYTQEIAHSAAKQGALSEELLGLNQMQVLLQTGIHQQAIEATQKRNSALAKLGQQVKQLSLINSNIVEGVERIDDIYSTIEEGNKIAMAAAVHTANLLQDIGTGITDLTDEVITSRMEIIQSIYDLKDVFIWSHREQMQVMQQILNTLKTPIQTKAAELWRLGEKCRNLGRLDDAAKMLERSIDENPTEYRSHLSLGLTYIKLLRIPDAMTQLNDAFIYGEEAQLVQSYSYLLLAKLFIYQGDFYAAYQYLLRALDKNKMDLNIWYEMSICLLRSGKVEDAKRLLFQLLDVDYRYIEKVIADQNFVLIREDIEEYMRKDTEGLDFHSRINALLKD